MAPYPRILFPYPTNTSDCLSFCSPPCDYYHLCPSDSPPPYSPTTTVIRLHHASHLPLHVIILTAAVLAATLLLLLTWCAVICFRRRRRRGTAAADTISVGGGDGGFFEEGETDHHVWYIRTVGLDESAIEAISMWVYKASDGILGSATADCAVCLGEFQDGEMLRLLPKCGHGFHVACIDTWLRSHVNCPICRAPVVAANANLASPSSSTNEEESSLGSSALPENTQMGVGESVIVTVDGNRIHADPSAEESSSSRHLSESEVLRSIEEEKSQFVRRSVSMDSSSLASLLLRLDLVERCVEESKGRNFEEEKGSKNIGKQGIASKEAPLQQTISLEMECYDMERSLSCSGSKLLLSRYGRARNAVLPL